MSSYIRWFGAALVLLAGGGFGFINARHYRKEEAALEELIRLLDYLTAELQCRLTVLPQLLGDAGRQGNGVISRVFLALQQELEAQALPDAACCMQQAIEKVSGIPDRARERLLHIGRHLGKFDLEGQLTGLESAKEMCRRELGSVHNEMASKLRSNQVLGLSAGAALVILLI